MRRESLKGAKKGPEKALQG